MVGKYKKFKTPIFLPKASVQGYDKYKVVTGDFIAWRYILKDDAKSDLHYGRVLGEATHDGLGEAYPRKPRVLAVLRINERFSSGFVVHVPVDIVEFCHALGAFTKWALFGEMVDPELTERLAVYGALSNHAIEKYLLDESGLKIVRTPWDKEPP
jgi:hypothetical protein